MLGALSRGKHSYLLSQKIIYDQWSTVACKVWLKSHMKKGAAAAHFHADSGELALLE